MKQREPTDIGLWAIILILIGSIILFFLTVLWTRAEAETASAGVAYCALYARELVRIDLMHTIPVKPSQVTDAYIEDMAVQVFKECVSVIPALIPLPEQHRSLRSWINDMRVLMVQRAGTVPATAAPIESDEEWRRQCAATYRTWEESTGTVVRKGSDERVKCPCMGEVVCD